MNTDNFSRLQTMESVLKMNLNHENSVLESLKRESVDYYVLLFI